MKIKTVHLKNRITTVPQTAILMEDTRQLSPGDKILQVWDVPDEKVPFGITRNIRLYAEVHWVDPKKGFGYGKHLTKEADALNATTCSHGWQEHYDQDDLPNFPKQIFLIDRKSMKEPEINFGPILKANSGFDRNM